MLSSFNENRFPEMKINGNIHGQSSVSASGGSDERAQLRMQQLHHVHLRRKSQAQRADAAAAAAPHRVRAAALHPHEHYAPPEAVAAAHRCVGISVGVREFGG